MNKNFKIIINGTWCEYQEGKHVDLKEIKSFDCYKNEIGGPYKFFFKSGGYLYIERAEIGKQIEAAMFHSVDNPVER